MQSSCGNLTELDVDKGRFAQFAWEGIFIQLTAVIKQKTSLLDIFWIYIKTPSRSAEEIPRRT